MNNDELPYHGYIDNVRDDFRETIATWRLTTMGAGDAAKYTSKEVDFYVMLIFDILYQKTFENTTLNSVSTAVDALQISTMEQLIADLGDTAEELSLDMEITKDNAERILGYLVKTENLKMFTDSVDVFLKGVEYTKTLGDLIEKLYMLMQIQNCSEELGNILTDLYEHSSDALLKEACRQIKLVSTGLLTESEIISIFSGKVLLSEISAYALDLVWEGIMNLDPMGQAVSIGKEVGKLASNLLFSTDAVVENWYSMEKVYCFEKVLKERLKTYQSSFEKNPTVENAKRFNLAADMCLNTLSVGMDYAVHYAEEARGGGVLGFLYKHFQKEKYEELIGALKSIQNCIDLCIEFANNETFNFYLEDREANSSVSVSWEETPCSVTQEEVEENTDKVPEYLFTTTDQTVSEDTSYSQNKSTFANMAVDAGVLNLAGKTLTVYGDFYLNKGTVNVNGGVLNILGNLYMTGGTLKLNGGSVCVGENAVIAKTNSYGEYVKTNPDAYLYMDYAEDRFTVEGDLISFFYYGYRFQCTTGIMSVGGNWINGATAVEGKDSFKMIFTGKNNLLIHGIYAITVPRLIVENASSRDITMQGTVTAGTIEGGEMTVTAGQNPVLSFNLTNHMTINGNVTFDKMNMSGYAAEVNGNLQVQDDVTLGVSTGSKKGSLKVSGDLQLTEGILYLNCGEVSVRGNAVFAKIDSNGNYTKTGGSAWLKMDHAEDRFTVEGDLISFFYYGYRFQCTTGIMSVGGNWINGAAAVEGKDSFKMIFTGKNDLLIHGIYAITVPRLIVENASSRNITMQGTVTAGTLEGGEITVTAGQNPVLSFESTSGELNFIGDTQLAVGTKAGGDITVEGNLISNGMAMGSHTLTVKKNLTLNTSGKTLALGSAGTINVRGDVWHNNGTLSAGGGTVNVRGNYYQRKGDVKVDKGFLKILGDYRIQSADDSSGERTWTKSDGRLYMTYVGDRVVVGGDFVMQSGYSHKSYLTAGTLAVLGDFYQLSDDGGNTWNFAAGGAHKVFLCGSEHQTASFDSTSSLFYILQLNKSRDRYTFNPDPCWTTLEENTEVPEEYQLDKIVQGVCGENLKWILDDAGTLTISGSGNMRNYFSYSEVPWYSSRLKIKKVILDENVTSIGAYAFYGCDNLSNITIPEGVTDIGDCAFKARDGFVIYGYENSRAQSYATENGIRFVSLVSQLELTSVSNISNGVLVKWKAVDYAEKYRILRKTGTGKWVQIADINSNSYTDTSVKSGSGYSYTVACISEDGKYYASGYDSTGKTIVYLSRPTVSSVENTASGVTLKWGKVTGAHGYYILRKTGTGNYAKAGTVTGETTVSYTDKTAESGTTYTYIVKAYSGSVYSSCSSTGKTIKYLAQPVVTNIFNDSTGVLVNWKKVTGASVYWIYRKTGSGSYTKIAETTGEDRFSYVSDADSLSYTDQTAKSGITYTYSVKACSGSAYSCSSVGKTMKYLSQPVISSVSNGSTGVLVKWGKVSGASGYWIYRKTGSGSYTKIGTAAGESTVSYTDKTVESGERYTYIVKAYSGSAYSSCNSTGKTIQYLSQPVVSGISNNSSGVSVTWKKVTGASAYWVYRKTGSGSYTKIGTVTGWNFGYIYGADTVNYTNKTAQSGTMNEKSDYLPVIGIDTGIFTDTTAKSGTTYTYIVQAHSDSAYSCNSVGKTIQYLSKPVISSVSSGSSGVLVKWGKVTGASGYWIYRKTGSGSQTKIATVIGGSTVSYTDKTAKSGTTYTYIVKAYSGTVYNSCDSTEKAIQYLSQPAVSSISNGLSGVTLKWGKVTGASGYWIYRKTGSGSQTKIATVTGGSTVSYTDKTAKSGTTYTYIVKAYSGTVYNSCDSTGETIKYLSQPAVSGLSNEASGVAVKWTKVTGASGYYIYRKTGSGSWEKVKTVSGGSTTSGTDTTVKSKNGTTYTYSVKAYSGSYVSSMPGGKTILRLTAPATVSVSNKLSKTITVKWSQNSSATGYQVKYVTGSTEKTVTVKGASVCKYNFTGMTKGKTYKIYVRSYKTVSGKNYYSAWSSAKSVKVTK